MNWKKSYSPWELSDIILEVTQYESIEKVHTYINKLMNEKDEDILEAIRVACVYYIEKNNICAESICIPDMEKLIDKEYKLEHILSDKWLSGLDMVIACKEFMNS